MLKTFFLSLCLASVSLASEVDLKTPSSAVHSYYNAINEGDVTSLKQSMVEDSYHKEIQIYALSIAFQDKEFHQLLKKYNSDKQAKELVTIGVQEKLKKRKAKVITIDKEVVLGENRVMVLFHEALKEKQLYLSYHKNGWKIDYLAGRKTTP